MAKGMGGCHGSGTFKGEPNVRGCKEGPWFKGMRTVSLSQEDTSSSRLYLGRMLPSRRTWVVAY